MNGKTKTLGLALIAVFAAAAVAASAAQAATHHVRVPTAPAIITAHQEAADPLILTLGASIECKKATFEGTVSENTNEKVTATPTYSECEWNEEPANVRTNHCAYILEGDTDANGDAGVEIECEGGSKIELEIPGVCSIRIGPQTRRGIHYTGTEPEPGRKDITIKATVTEIHYEKEGGLGCVFAGDGEHGEYHGSVTAEAFTEKAGCTPLTGTTKTTPGTYYDECENATPSLELIENATP